ncbi:MAG: prolyl oligopeptidase family serine peptidase [Pseudomonadota bacterium]
MRFILISLLTLMSSCAFTQTDPEKEFNKPAIQTMKNCFSGNFSFYDDFSSFIHSKTVDGEKRKGGIISRETFNKAKNENDCHYISYPNDGLNIVGVMVKPKQAKGKLPLIIYNRGGNGAFGANKFSSLFNYAFPYTEQGFMVMASQYRGHSKKREGFDEFGGADVGDVIKLLDLAKQMPEVDKDNIFVYGVSRGGMMTYMTLKQRDDINAVATIAACTDLISELDFRPAMERVYKKRIPDYQNKKLSSLKNRSVYYWADQLPKHTPILILHGSEDKRVSVQNAYKLTGKARGV